MKQPRVMIAATKSGSGKTTITCALLEALKDYGKHPRSFKCGPDYIDPMFHEQVIGIPSRNLDTFFSEPDQIRRLFACGQEETDISVIEGVMGLYDGLGGIREEGSAYHLARTLKTPIILVLDAHGMGRSVIPLLYGFMQYDKSNLIKGVILNRTSPMFLKTIAPVIEQELQLPVLGCYPVQKELTMPGRHLGLVMPGELDSIRQQICLSAEQLKAHVDLKRILQIAEEAEEIEIPADEAEKNTPGDARQKQLRMAVARDEAFCFYYQDNLRMLNDAGIELVPFSPIHDTALPENIQGILLGGGYPELYAKELESNEKMRNAIRQAIERKIPSVAECGGFMYLHGSLTEKNKETYCMAGVLHEHCVDQGKLVRFGYIEIRENMPVWLPENERIKGHEFHYFDSTGNGADCVAQKPVTGREWNCIHAGENYWWGYPHLYYPSNPAFVDHLVTVMKKFH